MSKNSLLFTIIIFQNDDLNSCFDKEYEHVLSL